MKNLHTFEEFLNESASTLIEDKGTLKTKLGNLKYVVNGGLERGGDRGSYRIPEEKLASLIGSIDIRTISKILMGHGIRLNARPSEFELNLTNTGLGYNDLSPIRPEIKFPVTLSKDWPERERGHVSRKEYAIYADINKDIEKVNNESYWIRFSNENRPSYGSTINQNAPMITIVFQDGSLA
jgi:hypothetical protein